MIFMGRARASRALLNLALVLVFSAAAFAVDARLLAMLPANAEAVGGVNVRNVMASGIARELMNSSKVSAAELQNLFITMGIDVQSDIQELVFAGIERASAPGSGKPPEMAGVGFITGRFDPARISSAILSQGGKSSLYKGNHLYTIEGPSNKSGDVMAFLDNATMVMGEPAQVKKILDKAPGGLAPALLTRVNSVSGRYDIWMVSAVSPAKVAGGLPADGPAGDAVGALAGDFFKKVESTQGGIKLGSTVSIGLEVISATPEDATALRNVLGFFRSMVASAPPKQGEPAPPQGFVNMLNAIQMRTDNKTLTISMDFPEADLIAFLKTAQSAAPASNKPLEEEIKIIQ